MRKNVLIALTLLLALSASEMIAQTKFIAHRSHSGSDDSFTPDCSYNYGIVPSYEMDEPDSIVTGIGISIPWKGASKIPAIDTTQQALDQPEILDRIDNAVETSTPLQSDGVVPSVVPSENPENIPPETDSVMRQAEPSISHRKQGTNDSFRIDQVYRSIPPVPQNRDGSLLWLALGLVVPAMGFVVIGMKRRDRGSIG